MTFPRGNVKQVHAFMVLKSALTADGGPLPDAVIDHL
jgi:hypothetical protein